MSDQDEQAELSKLRVEVAFYRKEHRVFAGFGALVLLGPNLVESLRSVFRAKIVGSAGLDEYANLSAAIIRRIFAVGFIGIFFASAVPSALAYWQNILIEDQNKYFREQISQQQGMIDRQEQRDTNIDILNATRDLYDEEDCEEPPASSAEIVPGLGVSSISLPQFSKCPTASNKVRELSLLFLLNNAEGESLGTECEQMNKFDSLNLNGLNFYGEQLWISGTHTVQRGCVILAV